MRANKTRGRELPARSQTIDKVISRVRVRVQHAIAGAKRCRLVADTLRHWRQGRVDQVMLAAAGLAQPAHRCPCLKEKPAGPTASRLDNQRP